MKISRVNIMFSVGYLLLSFAPVFLSENSARNYSFYNYLFQEFLALIFLFQSSDRVKLLLSPTFLAINYLNINFLLGSWAYGQGLSYNYQFLLDFEHWKNIKSTLLYFNISNISLLMAYFFADEIKLFYYVNLKNNTFRKVKKLYKIRILFISIIVLTLIYFILKITQMFLGIDISLIVTAYSIVAIIAIVLISDIKSKSRFFLYVLIIGLFVVFQSHDRRNAIFLILPIVFLELHSIKIKFALKPILITLSFSVLALYFILLMSIVRGYGQYNVDNVWDATDHVSDYIKKDSFIPLLMNNLEVNYVYFHSNQALEYIIEEPYLLTYGSTIFKFLFIPIPRRLFPEKPESIVSHYTSHYDKKFRSEGGSYPITIQSEFFWNFSYWGIFPLFIFFVIYNKMFFYLIEQVRLGKAIFVVHFLYAHELVLFYIRGSGLDIYLVYVLIASFFFLLVRSINLLLLPKKKLSEQ